MDHSESVERQLIKFLFVFSPYCFPAKILSILPAIQHYLVQLILEWLFFSLPTAILLS